MTVSLGFLADPTDGRLLPNLLYQKGKIEKTALGEEFMLGGDEV